MPHPTPAITIDNLSVHYGSHRALDEVTLDIAPASITGLIGPNGAGKSTLFRAMSGHVTPTQGTVQLHLDDAPPVPPASRQLPPGAVAYVPQTETVDWNFPLSVREVISAGRLAHPATSSAARWMRWCDGGRWWRRYTAEDRAHITAAMAVTDTADLADRPIGALSGGQRKRVFLARALAQQAQILLLDEPFAGVDVVNQRVIIDVLHDLRNTGVTIVLATHDLAGVRSLCDRVAMLNTRLVAEGPVAEVLTTERLLATFGAGVSADAA